MAGERKKGAGAVLHERFVQTQDKALLAKMIALYTSGLSLNETAEQTGKPVATVQRWLRRAGVASHPLGSAHKGKPWSAARRAATPPAQAKPVRPTVDGVELRGHELITHRALGNRTFSKQGYVVVHVGRKKRRYEHTIVAEKALGRQLTRGEVVHHINCDRADNRPENLLICSIKYHHQLHARMRRHAYWSSLRDSNTNQETTTK